MKKRTKKTHSMPSPSLPVLIQDRILPRLLPVLRLKFNMNDHYINLVAAGVAFYFFLAVFPALAALISLYGLFSDPHFVIDHINLLERFLPPEGLKIIADQAQAISGSQEGALGFGAFISLFLAVYAAAKGVNALIQGLNIVNGYKEKRNYLVLATTSVILTFSMLMYVMTALSTIAILPIILKMLFIPDALQGLMLWVRWPALFCTAVIGLEILYYFGPSRAKPRWRWFSRGSFIAAVLWVLASSLFSLFVLNFGKYNQTYGSLGAVVVLLLWLWLSALTTLIGAEINNLTRKNHMQNNASSA